MEILFNKRSCVTAKELAKALSLRGGSTVLSKNEKRRTGLLPDVTLRWGNSKTEAGTRIELNSKDAVSNACDKGKMMKILVDAGIATPEVVFNPTGAAEGFYRNAHDIVVKRTHAVAGDKYMTKDFEKVKEFRVHVFNGTTIGVYEKRPNDGNYSGLLKAENCSFVRIDQNIVDRGVRPIAKKSVEALGLLFGGVDVMINSSGKIVVSEVNSSPSLNTLNIDRWAEAIKKYAEELLRSNTSTSTSQ